MTTISLRITRHELAEIDRTATDLGMSRSELIRARLRWAVAMERVAYDKPEPLPLAAE